MEQAPGAAREACEERAGFGEPEEAQACSGPRRSVRQFPVLCKARKGGGTVIQNPCRKRSRNLNMEKLCPENEEKSENKGNMEGEQEPEDVVKQEVACTVDNKDELDNERKKEGDEILMEKEKVDSEAKLEQGEPVKEGQPESQEKPASEGKLESEEKTNEEKPTSETRAAEKRPAEDDVPRKVKRKTKGLAQCLKEHKEAIHDKHLSNEEMIKEFDKMAWVEDEVKKTRLKLGRFMCMHKSSEDASQPTGPRENQGGDMAPQKGSEDTSFM